MCLSALDSKLNGMYQAFKELRAAAGRTLLIIATVAMIAVLVSFLTSLTAGLAHQSKSELDRIAGGDISALSLGVADTGVPSLSASSLSDADAQRLGGQPLFTARSKVGDTPVMVVSNPDVRPGEALVSTKLADARAVQLGAADLRVTGFAGDVWLDHQPIVEANPIDVKPLTRGASAVVFARGAAPASTEGIRLLHGKDVYQVSASYTGENMSLSTMTYLLFVISALVVGAFFTVWTMQRLRGVAISAALGAARKVIVADALAQALAVLVIGTAIGLGITLVLGHFFTAVMPMVISTTTTLVPALLLIACGLFGAATSLRPILKVNPRTALAAA